MLAGRLVHTEFVAIFLKCLRHRGRWCDRVPRRHSGAAIHATQRGCAVAIGKDLVAHLVRPANPQAQRVSDVLLDVVASQVECLDIGLQQALLALVLFGKQLLEYVGIDVEQ